MKTQKSPLQQQLEHQRFLRAVSYVSHEAGGIKKINSAELVHLNQLLTDSSDDPWRFESAEIHLPSGKSHHFNMVSNPLNKARDILGIAVQKIGNDETIEGALYAYSELVLAHLFKDGNRRTAVLAAIWLLGSKGLKVDSEALLKIPLGDLRDQRDLTVFVEKFTALVSKSIT